MKSSSSSLLFIDLLAVFFSAGCHDRAGDLRKDPVNILLLLTDDQRWDALGYAGNRALQTPNLDSLARQGLYFENSFVTTAICCVSRASILTGQYGRYSGVQDFFTPIHLETTYPHYLKNAGYYTGFIGKWGTMERDSGYFMRAADLFDFWAGSMGQSNYWHERDCNFVQNNGTTEKHHFFCNCPPDSKGNKGEEIRTGKANMRDPVHQESFVIPDKVRKFLDQRDPGKPFCLSISFKAPHAPWSDYDGMFEHLYVGSSLYVSASVSVSDALRMPGFLRHSLNGIKDINELRIAHEINSHLQNSMRDYYRLISGMDQAVGKILAELRKRGLSDHTVILFYSDNGHFMGEHGFSGKWLMYEESMRVPGFIYDPRHIMKEGRTREMVLNIDLAPTILQLAGIDVPSGMQGKSLLPLLKDPDKPFREDFFYEHLYRHLDGDQHIERSEGVRTKEWKYIHYIDQAGPEAEELYHLAGDSLELHDLSDDHGFRVELDSLRKRCRDYFPGDGDMDRRIKY
jgi:arylsulfatase A-like enzyme